MAISIEDIKRLKEMTGVGLTDAKKALEETNGDFEKAVDAMRVKGMAKADKKADRETRQGLVDSYVHSDRIGVVVEVNCETDFVARTEDFKDFVHDIAMIIAAYSPKYIKPEDVSETEINKERELFAEEMSESGKPADMIEKIVDGKIEKYFDEVCLSRQPLVKDPEKNVEQFTKEMIAKLGENIVINNFARIELGQR